LTVLKKFVGDSRQLSDCLCGVYLLALYMHDLLTENGKGEMNWMWMSIRARIP